MYIKSCKCIFLFYLNLTNIWLYYIFINSIKTFWKMHKLIEPVFKPWQWNINWPCLLSCGFFLVSALKINVSSLGRKFATICYKSDKQGSKVDLQCTDMVTVRCWWNRTVDNRDPDSWLPAIPLTSIVCAKDGVHNQSIKIYMLCLKYLQYYQTFFLLAFVKYSGTNLYINKKNRMWKDGVTLNQIQTQDNLGLCRCWVGEVTM